MVADREEVRAREIPPPRQAKVEEQWERGQEVQASLPVASDFVPADAHKEYGTGYEQEQYHYEADQRDEVGQKRGVKGPSQPFRDVIFLGLDEELTEDDVSSPGHGIGLKADS
jgi:hypothetical protein